MEFHFCYDTIDKTQLGAEEISCQSLQDLFEIYPEIYEDSVEEWQAIENGGLYPEFVRDFPKLHDIGSDDDEDYGDDFYKGPSCAAEEFLSWAESWLNILQNTDKQERHELLPLATQIATFEWSDLLSDLHGIKSQAKCAARHDITMHIEMF